MHCNNTVCNHFSTQKKPVKPLPQQSTASSSAAQSPSSLSYEDMAAKLESSLLEGNKETEAFKQKLDENGKDLLLMSRKMDAVTQLAALQSELDFSTDTTTETTAPSQNFTVFSKESLPPNGSKMECCWRIPNFSKALEDAQKLVNEYLESPVWISGPCGYCMKAILYLNGYEKHKGKHVSLFLCVQKGDYDDRNKWPLQALLTFALLDLKTKNSRLYLRSCRLDRTNPPFTRPPQESDFLEYFTAAGLPDFIPITDMIENYVKNDAIMLEFKVSPE